MKIFLDGGAQPNFMLHSSFAVLQTALRGNYHEAFCALLKPGFNGACPFDIALEYNNGFVVTKILELEVYIMPQSH